MLFKGASQGLPMGVRLIQWFARSTLLSEKRKIELYFPFLFMRIRVLELDPQWRRVRIKLPLSSLSRNANSTLFGGFQCMLSDPIAALACARRFRDYSVWTRAMTVDFRKGGDTDLELRFEFTEEQERQIAKELAERGRATPTFEYAFFNQRGELCTRISNTVAIRPPGYKSGAAPTDANTFGGPRT